VNYYDYRKLLITLSVYCDGLTGGSMF
jgi:hypothetical protein